MSQWFEVDLQQPATWSHFEGEFALGVAEADLCRRHFENELDLGPRLGHRGDLTGDVNLERWDRLVIGQVVAKLDILGMADRDECVVTAGTDSGMRV